MAAKSYPVELTAPDIEPYRKGNTGIEFVTSFDSGVPGPHVAINAITHGNEICGAIALDALLKQGVRDMVRISDARMSGTSYGTCVLHVAPESHVGGPLALVQDGDLIELDVAGRKLNLLVSEEEMARRKAAWTPPKPHYQRGYGAIFQNHITQADKGCDFDILEAGGPTPEPEIH